MSVPSWDRTTGESYWPVAGLNPNWPAKVVLDPDGRLSLIGIPNPLPPRALRPLAAALTAAAEYLEGLRS